MGKGSTSLAPARCDLQEGGAERPGWLVAQEKPEIGLLREISDR